MERCWRVVVVTGLCGSGMVRVGAACAHLKATLTMSPLWHGGQMERCWRVGVMTRLCGCGMVRVDAACTHLKDI